jgi:hypothetical protein
MATIRAALATAAIFWAAAPPPASGAKMVTLGLGRIVALYYRSSTTHQNR